MYRSIRRDSEQQRDVRGHPTEYNTLQHRTPRCNTGHPECRVNSSVSAQHCTCRTARSSCAQRDAINCTAKYDYESPTPGGTS